MWDQLIITQLIFFFILITYLVDIVLILQGEILSWSLMGVKGLKSAIIVYVATFHSSLSLSSKVSCSGDLRGYAIK